MPDWDPSRPPGRCQRVGGGRGGVGPERRPLPVAVGEGHVARTRPGTAGPETLRSPSREPGERRRGTPGNRGRACQAPGGRGRGAFWEPRAVRSGSGTGPRPNAGSELRPDGCVQEFGASARAPACSACTARVRASSAARSSGSHSGGTDPDPHCVCQEEGWRGRAPSHGASF